MPISPEQLAAKGDEHSHQVAFFQWLAIRGAQRYPDCLMAHAIPNGAKLMGVGTQAGRIEGAKMKSEGVRSGVPDVFLPVATYEPGPSNVTQYHGLWIEFKKPGRSGEKLGGRSDDQEKWQRKLVAQDYAVVTAYGWQAGAHALSSYLSGSLEMPEGGDCYFELERLASPW